MKHLVLLVFLCVSLTGLHAEIVVRDDHGNTIVLNLPASRIISLAPHATELLFAAGAGEHVIGTVTYSDYPAAAKSIPRVGDHHRIDLERLISLKPDLLVVWPHGGSARQIDALKRLGIPLFYSEPKKLTDIPDTLERIGRATGTEQQARQRANQLRERLDQLAATYRDRSPVTVFYQVWRRPLYTLSGAHIVSDAIRLCGGRNIFQELTAVAPTVSVEAVLLADPEAIIDADRPDLPEKDLEHWKQYPALRAVKRDNLFSIDTDLIDRAGPRMIEGTAALCAYLEEARNRREK